MKVLGEHMLRKFEDYMVGHLRQDFADQVKNTPEDSLRSTIQKGISKAERYDIRIEYNVERYIDLMFMLGHDFDVASGTKWAGELLNNKDMPPDEKINRIYYRLENKL